MSVVICTHNPRVDYFNRVLDALQAQTLDRERWELILVDNQSATPISDWVDVGWHRNANLVVEARLGLINARLKGVQQSRAELIVFVDDDNVLDPGYLESAEAIATSWPLIGAFGGQLVGEFEAEPEPQVKPYLGLLGIRTLTKDRWSNLEMCWDTVPYGAGMCIRREVADQYSRLIAAGGPRDSLGVSGDSLLRCEDIDLAFTAADMGLGTGLFQALRLKHLMPQERLTMDYMVRLVEGHEYSAHVLQFLRGQPLPTRRREIRLWLGNVIRVIRRSDEADIRRASDRGRRRAVRFMRRSRALNGGRKVKGWAR